MIEHSVISIQSVVEALSQSTEAEVENAAFQVALDEHNRLRRDHCSTPDLEFDLELAAVSQKIADKNVFAHSDEDYGENLSFNWEPNIEDAIRSAVSSFYNENKYYNWDEPSSESLVDGKAIGHFTQVMSR